MMVALAVGLAAQMALGIVFLVSALFKWRHPASLVSAVASYGIVPARAAPVAAGVLAATETALAASLLSGFGDQLARLAATGLLTGFLIVVGWTVRQGGDHACGCFSPDERVSSRSVLRLALLLGLAVLPVTLPAGGLLEASGLSGGSGLLYSAAIGCLAFGALGAGHLLLEASRLFALPPPRYATRTKR